MHLRDKLLGIFLCLAHIPAMAFGSSGQLVCVRDFLKPEGAMDFCERGLPGFMYVTDMDEPDVVVCTKVYDEDYCKQAPKEFDHVESVDGAIVCTVNYHQPPISYKCGTNPDLYRWVMAAYPPN